VERVIGTMMQMVHELPGTTFSSTAERGGYNSDANAVLTLRELQRWLALAVASYHGQVHETLGRTPVGVWAENAAEAGPPVTVTSEAAVLVDFLPVIRRTLTRSGFVVDRVQYYRDALKPWIARREQLGRFVLRRDPRDISRIWAHVAGQDRASGLVPVGAEMGQPRASARPMRVCSRRSGAGALIC
jgi:putative transposase